MHKTKRNILIFVFIINLLITSTYIIFKYIGYVHVSKVDFTLLLMYDIISFIILGELIEEKNKIK